MGLDHDLDQSEAVDLGQINRQYRLRCWSSKIQSVDSVISGT